MISLRSLRCLSRRALARISMSVMFVVSSTNIGASEISPIRRASFVQSSSDNPPDRSTCSGTRDSADSSRITISTLLISRLNTRLAKLLRIDVARTKSNAAVELCVGIIDLLARYRWSSLSTSTHRTGTLGIGRTSTMKREPERTVVVLRRRSLWAIRLRSSRNTSSWVVNVRVYATEDFSVRPLTRFVVTWQRYPRLTTSSYVSSANRWLVTENWTAPDR